MSTLDIEEAAKRLLPHFMVPATMHYILYGIPMGSFGTAVFSNDLLAAFRRADDVNFAAMFLWADFLHHHAPRQCHGSSAAVRAWQVKGGLRGDDSVSGEPL